MDYYSETYLYFILAADVNRIKIGRANDPKRRLSALQVGCPVRLILLLALEGQVHDEAWLHMMFGDDRIDGEWFEFSEKIEAFIHDAKKSDTHISGMIGNRRIYCKTQEEPEDEKYDGLPRSLMHSGVQVAYHEHVPYGKSRVKSRKVKEKVTKKHHVSSEQSIKNVILAYRNKGKSWSEIAAYWVILRK